MGSRSILIACAIALVLPFVPTSAADERVLVYERSITTQLGAHGDIDTRFLPPVTDGRIEICVDTCDPSAMFLGAGMVDAIVWEGVAIDDQAARHCVSAGTSVTCPFTIGNPDGWNLELAWSQLGMHTVTVRVTGVPS